jgi:hypothetical protein
MQPKDKNKLDQMALETPNGGIFCTRFAAACQIALGANPLLTLTKLVHDVP